MSPGLRFIIANALLFQIGWFVCILGGDLWALVFTGAVLAGHFWFSPCKRNDLLALIIALGIGLIHDTLLIALGYIRFVETTWLPPLWLVCIWVLFGISLLHSLNWVYQRIWFAAALGIIAGPLSYLAGVSLSTAEWGASLWELIPVIGLMWLLVLPVHRFIYLRLSHVLFIKSFPYS
jgi:hypothetical protein